MANMYDVLARRVPPKIRAIILQEQFIDKALNVELRDTPMEYLFDVYQEFVDSTREYDDWSCHKCRGHVLEIWKRMKPFLERVETGN
jgi:hypothetical protein